MRPCKGSISDGSKHRSPGLFECTKCGRIGCKEGKCSMVAFHPYNKCLKCGSTDNHPVPERN